MIWELDKLNIEYPILLVEEDSDDFVAIANGLRFSSYFKIGGRKLSIIVNRPGVKGFIGRIKEINVLNLSDLEEDPDLKRHHSRPLRVYKDIKNFFKTYYTPKGVEKRIVTKMRIVKDI
jgi:hypothetical protein